MKGDIRRLFFGFEVCAPWPSPMPDGRMLEERNRHLTISFLGNTSLPYVLELIPEMPKPTFKIGIGGIFEQCLFLPEKNPHVVAWEANWLDSEDEVLNFQKTFSRFLEENKIIQKDDRKFLSHVTVCRNPFPKYEWKRQFTRLPLFIKNFNLYESLQNSIYEKCWTHQLKAPFEEISHTADVAFLIRGSSMNELFKNSFLALCFNYPGLLDYYSPGINPLNIDELIIELNRLISKADSEKGAPFKAVSFHGDMEEVDGHLVWEMIVDV